MIASIDNGLGVMRNRSIGTFTDKFVNSMFQFVEQLLLMYPQRKTTERKSWVKCSSA